MDNSVMDRLAWENNSKKMYEIIIAAVPMLLQSGMKRLVANWVEKHEIYNVTEDNVFEVLEEIAPKAYVEKILPVLTSMRTK